MQYTVIIRTLGKAGVAYQTTLNSVMSQTIRPSAINIYIADGFALPNETVGVEKYIYVPKGMVAQRARTYDEVHTEFCLFLDDDVWLPCDAVEKMYAQMHAHGAQVISPCTFSNHKYSIKTKLLKTLTCKEVCRIGDKRWAFKVLRTAGFSYNNNPTAAVYESQSNAGPCFFCRKDDFIKVCFQEELWLDNAPYALPEDQVLFYKMYKKGFKVLTSFDTGVVHLDAGTTMAHSIDRIEKLIFSEYRNKLIFWHRFIFLPEKSILLKLWSIFAISYVYSIQLVKYSLFYMLGRRRETRAFWCGIKSAFSFLASSYYRELPLV